jgi:4-hydroxyphenylacetate 3-monooxygenase
MSGSELVLTLRVLGTGEVLTLAAYQAVVAGYTGRDEKAVRHHIEELAAIGVPAPARVPMFYPIASASVTTAASIEVAGDYTSGEVEPVLVRHHSAWFLGVGSDHTDRTVETHDIGESKRVCPKPICEEVIPVAEWAGLDWDAIGASSTVDGKAYQDGHLRALRDPEQLVRLLSERGVDEGRDLVCFAGTLPLIDGSFVAGMAWELRLTLPDGRAISHWYEVRKV